MDETRGQRILKLALEKQVQQVPSTSHNNEENCNNLLNEALLHNVVMLGESETDVTNYFELDFENNLEYCNNDCYNQAENFITMEYENPENLTPHNSFDNVFSEYQYSSEITDKPKYKLVDYSSSDSNITFTSTSEQTNAEIGSLQHKEVLCKEPGKRQSENENKENDGGLITNSSCNSESTLSRSSNYEDDESTSSSSDFRGKRIKTKSNKTEINNKLRLSGKAYFNYKNKEKGEKNVLPNPCFGKKCINKCNTFTEEERRDMFNLFWKLDSNINKRAFINGCVNIVPIKRKRTMAEDSRRNLTYQYFFIKNDVQVKVCLQFFLSTLNITQKLVRNAIKGKVNANMDKRGKHSPKHKITPIEMEDFKKFIESLPSVPSHYCRGSSSRLYLPAEIKTISNLYRMYSSIMQNQNKNPIGISSFKKFFKRDYNIGIHVPKKDKCATCERYKNISEIDRTEHDQEIYLRHQKEKNEAKLLFMHEQNKSTKDEFLVVSFDLEKVLSTPHGPNMMFGFSRKYAYYNFTVYESKSQNGYCFLWGEKDGKRGVNEICSNLYSYLTRIDQSGTYRHLSLFCDNCPGQNKNRFLPSMLLYFLKNSVNIQEITLTYLVAGHTYMPVDSVHAVIEKHIRGMNIQAPSEWATIIRNARKRPRPYETIQMKFSEFFDWKALTVLKKLKTAEGTDVKLSDIKRIRFSKADLQNVSISMSYNSENRFYKVEWVIKKLNVIPRLYFSQLPINKKKLKNLLELCTNLIIKQEYHPEYNSLSANGNVPDVLAESDVEDE